MLVRNGHAESWDEECRLAAAMTPDELEEAKERYHKLAMGRATGNKRYDSPDPEQEGKSLADVEQG